MNADLYSHMSAAVCMQLIIML